jgi:phenylalanyl-tRNA synthetase beta chain
VPLALVGAELPPAQDGGAPFAIQLGKLRGVDSFGMLCSARELKLSDDHAGLLELPADAPLGTDVREQLSLDDTVFTLKLTPNLAHALSVYGVAREVSALTGAPLRTPTIEPVPPRHDQKLPVRVLAPDLCGRFSGRVIRNVNTRAKTPGLDGRTPGALRPALGHGAGRHLELRDVRVRPADAHLRPGQDPRRPEVRWGRAGESLKLLNGNTIELDASVGVIADAVAVESLAGIMGGDATAVSDDTRHVYVEAAFWWPQAVAGRSRRFNFTTDAGHRFERGVDPALDGAAHRACHAADPADLRRRSRARSTTSAPRLPPRTPVRCAWRAQPR